MVSYEWDIEEWDYDDDNEIEITDHWFQDKLSSYPKEALEKAITEGRLVLVRDDDTSRLWAYTKDGKMPEYFSILEADGNYYETGFEVPKKYLNEFSKTRG